MLELYNPLSRLPRFVTGNVGRTLALLLPYPIPVRSLSEH